MFARVLVNESLFADRKQKVSCVGGHDVDVSNLLVLAASSVSTVI